MAIRRKGNWSSLWEQPGLIDDRRGAPRYPARQSPACLAWTGEKGYRRVAALLSNLSAGGALALVGERPPQGARVRINLRLGAPNEWVEATVVRVRKSRLFFPGPFQVSLEFAESCPYEVFKTIIEGFGHVVTREP